MISSRFLLRISLVLTLGLFVIFQFPHTREIPKASYRKVYQTAVIGRKGVFAQAIADTEIDGPFDGSSLKELCQKTRWTPGLIFKCDPPTGGVGIVRNIYLNCLRFAIEAGATSFIIPEMIASRKLPDVAQGNKQTLLHANPPQSFERFFDLEHFTHSLSTTCPEMRTIPHQNELWDKPSTAIPLQLDPFELSDPNIGDVILSSPEKWAENFRDWLNKSHPKPYNEEKPVVVTIMNPLLQLPLEYDEPQFVANFGKVLRFREDVRRLAGTVIYALNQRFGFGIHPDRGGVQEHGYYGAHLRTEGDATSANWTDYEDQAESYLKAVKSSGLKVVYLTTGNDEDKIRFAKDAANSSVTVVTKEDLLSTHGFEKEFAEMQNLGWEQKLLIDYQVLLRSSIFGGTHESSFSWNIAMRRHVLVGDGSWIPIGNKTASHERSKGRRSEGIRRNDKIGKEGLEKGELWKSIISQHLQDKEERQSFRDGLSTIFGPVSEGRVFGLAVWP
ncbi:hypothetical protein HYFRA_00012863 [Hymenoscyphus fraxineus]|uniref:Alternative oxidase n=1 Tax=Hymenoscyphus fraxineus TaxID=746836 RepID=A0A9N9L8V0_9HELO|nr:hypothetical protein HYFRA_00012863 [Hymenoscyphus fraxineus]